MSEPEHLVSLDPALRNCGVAHFHKGQLVGACAILNPRGRGPGAWLKLATGVQAWVRGQIPRRRSRLKLTVASEMMEARNGNPNDLLQITGVTGAVFALLSTLGELEDVVGYVPKMWKGTLPKAPCSMRILSRLNDAEKKVLQEAVEAAPHANQYDIFDAVGVGLHRLRRLKIVRGT